MSQIVVRNRAVATSGDYRRGVVIDWRQHARIGVPVTIATMTMTALYLWWRMRG